jgi:transcriptional regulator of met regulon
VCGDRLTGKSAHGNGGKIGYYEHSWATRRQACLDKKIFDHAPQRIPAKIIEPKVWERVIGLLTEPSNSQLLIEAALNVYRNENQVQNTDRLRSKVRGIEEQIEALAEHLAKIPKGLSPTPIFSQMEKLEALKNLTAEEVDEILRSGVRSEPPTALPRLPDLPSANSAAANNFGFAGTQNQDNPKARPQGGGGPRHASDSLLCGEAPVHAAGAGKGDRA